MKRSILILAGIISFIAASLAFITADAPKYKNLKVLKKDISKQELDSVMRFFTMSLGEKCNFCHVRNEAEKTMDFPSDANPNKNTARFMMRMAAKINKKYFKDQEKENENIWMPYRPVETKSRQRTIGYPPHRRHDQSENDQ